MEQQIRIWHAASDRREIFLKCYQMMSMNTLEAIETDQFADPNWVHHLLHRFAQYYFEGLAVYEKWPAEAPRVWQVAHNAAAKDGVLPVQLLVMGISAHINYDLVLTLQELLEPEWRSLSSAVRRLRYSDHCKVNEIIGLTIDSVQHTVLDPAWPIHEKLDALLGRADEVFVSHLVSHWREAVWENTLKLLETNQSNDRAKLLEKIENYALMITKMFDFNTPISRLS